MRLPDIGKALAEFRKIPALDAAQQAKTCWGLVAEGLDTDQAAQLEAALNKAGLKSRTIPTTSLIKPPEPRRPTAIDMKEDGLHLTFKSGAAGILPWKLISLVGTGSFKETSYRTEKIEKGEGAGGKAVRIGVLLTTGIPLPGKRKQVEEVKKEVSDIGYVADLFTSKPLGRVRLDPLHLNFGFLKERKQMNVLGNFREMMGDILQKAPHAILNTGARVLKEGRPLTQMLYDSPADYEKESRWLLSLAAI